MGGGGATTTGGGGATTMEGGGGGGGGGGSGAGGGGSAGGSTTTGAFGSGARLMLTRELSSSGTWYAATLTGGSENSRGAIGSFVVGESGSFASIDGLLTSSPAA